MFSCSDAIYDPSTMTANELDALTDWLYPAHCQVFDGVTKDAFRAYVIEPDVLRTRIEVYTDPAGRAIGYTAIHLFERTVSGRRCLVVRMEAGLTSELRSSGISMPFSMDELVRCRRDFPDDEIYYLGCFVSPASYLLFSKCAPVSWPHPSVETPVETLSLMCALADSFDLTAPDPSRPLVRDVGWTLREGDADIGRFARSRRTEVRHYLDLNPDYTDGLGLLYLMPLGWDTLDAAASGGRSLLGARIRLMAPERAPQGELCL